MKANFDIQLFELVLGESVLKSIQDNLSWVIQLQVELFEAWKVAELNLSDVINFWSDESEAFQVLQTLELFVLYTLVTLEICQ